MGLVGLPANVEDQLRPIDRVSVGEDDERLHASVARSQPPGLHPRLHVLLLAYEFGAKGIISVVPRGISARVHLSQSDDRLRFRRVVSKPAQD